MKLLVIVTNYICKIIFLGLNIKNGTRWTPKKEYVAAHERVRIRRTGVVMNPESFVKWAALLRYLGEL